jgi:GNAT superfamily N-acetyltransferase
MRPNAETGKNACPADGSGGKLPPVAGMYTRGGHVADITIRPMNPSDRSELADLICVSTNYWYRAAGKPAIFNAGPAATALFADVYEALDPGCCVVAEDPDTRRLMGSCFYHPRETHVSLGIMNVHPNYFGRGVARRLLGHIVELADRQGKPVRLVSSAMNLDSFSLYTRAGFVPRAAFQDMMISVPAGGLRQSVPGAERVRPAAPADLPRMVDLEMRISHIRREKDYRHFIQNPEGIWHVSIYENPDRSIDGFLASVAHPGSNMLGPGVARSEDAAAALVLAELNHNRGRSPVFLVPVDRPGLVRRMYDWGAKNVEIHFCQVRGHFEPFAGVVMPTFMPETG